MRTQFSVDAILAVVFAVFLFAGSAFAQGGNGIFVTPIPNSPFMALIDVERSVVRSNGQQPNLKTQHAIARDSQGRIYNEMRQLLAADANGTPQLLESHIYDPQTRISIILYPRQRLFRRSVVNRPPAIVPPAFSASPSGNGLPMNDYTQKEDLGTRSMEGLLVHGIREVQTIPASTSGTGQEVVVTDEYWYSDDLRLNMMVKHTDPRSESYTMTVSQVTRAEPDSAVFEIPAGYKDVKLLSPGQIAMQPR